MTPIRREIFRKLEELSERFPHWRFGQLVANVSYWAKEPTVEAIWVVEDHDFLSGITSHLEQQASSAAGEPRARLV
jgi:hypothetical protein